VSEAGETGLAKLWTLDELEAVLRVCDKTVRKLIKLGRLTRVPDCRKILVTDASVRALLGASEG
jgi:hypothetical protein